MGKGISVALLGVAAGMVFLTGCASKGQTQRQINSLQAQVGVLTDEMIRLDEQLQTSRGAIQDSAGDYGGAPMGTTGGAVLSGAVYRTPSGFELPAVSIQQALKNAGYYQGAVDGKIGPASRKAVQAFQRDNGLTADGIVGRNTWQKLKVYSPSVK